MGATWRVPRGKERKAKSRADLQKGIEAAGRRTPLRDTVWKCPEDNSCFYDHLSGVMGLEFRNNSYKENQNQVLPSPQRTDAGKPRLVEL